MNTNKYKSKESPANKKQATNVCEIIKEPPVEDLRQTYQRTKTQFDFSSLDDSSFSSHAERIQSILVKTGVFQGDAASLDQLADDDLVYSHKDMIIDNSLRKPDFLCENVHEAVKLIFEKENFT